MLEPDYGFSGGLSTGGSRNSLSRAQIERLSIGGGGSLSGGGSMSMVAAQLCQLYIILTVPQGRSMDRLSPFLDPDDDAVRDLKLGSNPDSVNPSEQWSLN